MAFQKRREEPAEKESRWYIVRNILKFEEEASLLAAGLQNFFQAKDQLPFQRRSWEIHSSGQEGGEANGKGVGVKGKKCRQKIPALKLLLSILREAFQFLDQEGKCTKPGKPPNNWWLGRGWLLPSGECWRIGMGPQAGKFLHKFEPFVPERIWVEEKTFCCAFPFHIIFDETLKIKQAGINLQKFVPGLKILGTRLDKYFSIVHPQVTFTIFSICKFINSQFVLRTQRNKLPQSRKKQPALKLRGQMIWMESLQCMMYLCSPKLHSLEELEEQQMHLSDLAQHDTTRDLILFNQQRLAEIELSNQLERKKEELRILSKNLEAEKKKSETLLYTMLPKYVANQLKEGKKVEAGDFSSCTILFSDVVTFTNICSVCEPSQIVNMLNSMYSKFDRLTSVHGAYKVETIGDAYMVVGGIPVPVTSHAERVANFALGMRIAAKDVMNPITDKPMQLLTIPVGRAQRVLGVSPASHPSPWEVWGRLKHQVDEYSLTSALAKAALL
ncbi:Guanylate cyclase soluble subunit beta-2 [Varanus komodoensis]|nr:Guanylate cyclase soluble subunit beta-2 [Varanus komodoensis]